MERNRGGRPRHPDILTPAEWRVLEELRTGGTNAEIAVRLGVSPDAVKYHISNMLGKLELEDRHALAAWRGKREGVGTRVRALLALPLALSSLGRKIAWVGAAGMGVAALAAVVIVVITVLRGGDDDLQLPVASEATQTQQHTPQPTATEPVDAAIGQRDLAVELFWIGGALCALRQSGQILCWNRLEVAGPGESLSDWVIDDSSCFTSPAPCVIPWPKPADGLAVPTGVFLVAAGDQGHACAIRTSGEIVCWGDNEYGQIDAPTGRFKLVSVGRYHSCAIRNTGEAACWGANHLGQSAAPAGSFRSLSATFLHTCGVRRTGAIFCWGSEDILADPPAGTFREVVTTPQHTCAIRESGAISCWATTDIDQEGLPPALADQAPPEGAFRSLSVGDGHACALRESGETACWGDNTWGALDAPSGRFRALAPDGVPCAVSEEGTVVCWSVLSSPAHISRSRPPPGIYRELGEFCALRESGEIVCWGSATSEALPPMGAFRSLSVAGWGGQFHSCAVRATGEIDCWGDLQSFRLGCPEYACVERTYYRALEDYGQKEAPPGLYLTVSTGGLFTCAIRESGEISCWGANAHGEADVPTGRFRLLEAAAAYACAIRQSGEIACWGDNRLGQTDAPPGTFQALSVGSGHACAIRESGEVACWGSSQFGQTEPPPGRFTAVDAGPWSTCGILGTGVVECWGRNDWGESDAPPGRYRSVRVGDLQTCAIRESGEIECWGEPAGVPAALR